MKSVIGSLKSVMNGGKKDKKKKSSGDKKSDKKSSGDRKRKDPKPSSSSSTASSKATKGMKPKKTGFSDKYTLGEKLGEGNFSVVRLATDAKGRKFAVKCMNTKKLQKEDIKAIQLETGILKTMDHPHIIKLCDFYEENDTYYVVTELVTGGELFDRIVKKEYYSEQDAQQVLRTIAEALAYCHKRGVVHRDLKPENILLTSPDDDSSIKLADFGFAKMVVTDDADEKALSTACGTPGYVAPEIVSRKRYGSEVDMWSLGVILYILLCGYPPFYNENQKKLFQQIKKGEYKFDSPYWDHVSETAKDLIRGLLCVNGEDRLDIDAVLNHPWLNEENTSAKDITPALQELRSYQARRRWKTGLHVIGGILSISKMKPAE